MKISAIILSGGRATRMNSVDKGLIQLQQKPLVAHVIARLKPQVDEILINANREIMQYEAFGLPVLQDENMVFLGPLAGFSLGLQHGKHDYVLTVPCDSPLLPLDLAQRLMAALLERLADIVVASSDSNAHPVFCLMRKTVLPSLMDYLAKDNRKVSTWQKSLRYVEVDFQKSADAFVNLNTFEDLAGLEQRLAL